LRDRRLPQIEIVHESDFALPFSNGMTIPGLRAPHRERTRRHADYQAAKGVLEF
jgi:hypothetical protein